MFPSNTHKPGYQPLTGFTAPAQPSGLPSFPIQFVLPGGRGIS